MENYNLNIQQQLNSKTVLQLGYVGSQGHRCGDSSTSTNPLGAINGCRSRTVPASTGCDGGIQDLGQTAVPALRRPKFTCLPEPGELIGGNRTTTRCKPACASSDWHGLTSIVNFVCSNSLDNSSDGEDFEPNAAQPQDSINPANEYGPSNFNIRSALPGTSPTNSRTWAETCRS